MNTHNKTNKTALIALTSLLFFLGFFTLAQAGDVMAKEQKPGRYAFIEEATGKVTNVILLDPSSNWSAPAGYLVILSDKAEHGDIWNGHEFKRTPKEEPEPESSSIKTDGNDIAELMQAESSILPGNLVAVSENGLTLRKTDKPYDKNIIGVIAIKPGIVLGRAENGMSLPVVLTGRVPLKVSTENGPIEPGDAITSSSTPGVGMKATKPGRVVGIALEAWSESLFNGSVMILINPHWQGGSLLSLSEQNGQIGIGTTAPFFKLDVWDMQIATASAQIFNTATGIDADGLIVKLGNTSATAVASTNHFISFETSGIGIVGSIQGNGGTGVTYATSGIADFAEYFKKDANQTIEFGSVVCLQDSGLAAPCDNNNGKIIGVASERPAFLGGENLGNGSIAVGLVGQVRTRVSSANGVIKIGDPLTSSSNLGIAVKATSVGQIVGKALESYDGPNGEIGEILVSVNISWYNPSVYISYDGALAEIRSTASSLEEQLALQGEALQAQIASSSASAQFVLGNDPLFKDSQDRVSALESKLNLLSEKAEQQASISAFLAEIVNSQVLGVKSDLADASTSATPIQGLGDVELDNLTVAQDLMVLSRATVTDLGVTGTINAGLLAIHGLDGEINTLSGDLYLQKDALGGINIFDGKIVMDTKGNLTVAGTITANLVEADNYTVLGQESIGSATIPAGVTSIEVSTAIASSSSKIFLTTTSLTDKQITVVQKSNGKFKVAIPQPSSSSISFDWWIVGNKHD